MLTTSDAAKQSWVESSYELTHPEDALEQTTEQKVWQTQTSLCLISSEGDGVAAKTHPEFPKST